MTFSSTLLALIPAGFLLAALLPWGDGAGRSRWPLSLAAALLAVGCAAITALLLLTGVTGASAGALVRVDGLTVTMLLLVTGIAGVILRFSQRYLDGEPGVASYQRWFLATMAGSTLLVITNHLLVLAFAWTATSIALHQLLTFYSDRPHALVAAHKKFLLSRLADLAIFAAVALFWRATGTFAIDALVAQTTALPRLPLALEVGGVLLVLGVLLRSAQLPFHGWLIQVMEAPTPVSALLHAGIVNIGGFVLIRLGGVMGLLDAAQSLLVVAGSLTAVLAALVMTTRVSVKVSLAWSTCAQMGFMLLECGLGAYGLALLHLLAHSVYKAHAFLSSGRVVHQASHRASAPATAAPTLGGWALAALAAVALVGGLATMLDAAPLDEPARAAITVVAALALAPLLLCFRERTATEAVRLLGTGLGLAGLYGVGHALVGPLVPSVPATVAHAWARSAVVIIAFVSLYGLQALLTSRPRARLAQAWYPACFAGFYLDELFTRVTFRIWPPRPEAIRATAPVLSSRRALERAA